jgi:hypothetical protein
MAKQMTSKDALESLLGAADEKYGDEIDFQEVEEAPYSEAATVQIKIGNQVFELTARFVGNV